VSGRLTEGLTVGIERDARFEALDADPDDYRPGSEWALSVDPDRRSSLAVVRERIGVGDRIPRHWHDVDEVVLYEAGEAVAHLDGADHEVRPGATVFIPAGSIHGTVNTGAIPVEIRAVFPTTVVRMDMVERNPAPGTEDRRPQSSTYDLATGSFVVHGPTDLGGARR
jgi:quercetin dioxygenase-like cupin family protein